MKKKNVSLLDNGDHRVARARCVPECAGIQPSGVLDISRELALEKVQALECRLVNRHECRQ